VWGGHAEPVSIEGFSLCRTNLCNDWLQVGWGKVLGYTMPKGYCEFNHVNGSLELVEWAMTAATHKFTVQYHRATGYWECFMDGVWKTANPVGFASGTYLNAQGEVRTVHTQIGRNAPGKLLFSNMSREFDDLSNGWTTFNVTLADPDSPYGNSEPQPGQFKNWTNAH
jgi:hypothetical protein